MRVQCIDLPPDSAPAAGPPTTADEQSISLSCLWCLVLRIDVYGWRSQTMAGQFIVGVSKSAILYSNLHRDHT